MSWDDPFWWPHRVRIRELIPGGSRGPRLAETDREVLAEVKDEARLVRTADGREVTSSSSVTIPETENVPLGSQVTVWPGRAGERTAFVLVIAREENEPPLSSHIVLSLG